MSAPFDFPHRVDALRGDVQWVTCDRARLRAATFLDGREKFWSTQRVEALADRPPPGMTPPAVIFHVGFCGSTLLARLLDQDGVSLVLREPQALTDIASQAGRSDPSQVSAVLRWTLPHLAAAAGTERCVIKPSNWVNGLAPELAGGGHVGRAVFLDMAPRAFLRAVFRGGRDRLAHCLRLAELLAQGVQGGDALMQAAMHEAGDPLDRAALLSALLHRFQTDLFDRAQALMPVGHTLRLAHAELVGDMQTAARRTAAVLGLPDGLLSGFNPARHAKDAAQDYSPDAENRSNREVERHHADRFDKALDWIDRRSSVAASR